MTPFRYTNSVTRFRRRFDWRQLIGPLLFVIALLVAGTLDYQAEQWRQEEWRASGRCE